MKKLLFMMSVVLFALTACEGPEGPPGPPGEPGLPGGERTEWEVEFIEVLQEEWVKVIIEEDVYWECVKTPDFFRTASDDLRQWIYNDGSVFAYMFMNYDTPNETQYLMPYVVNWSNGANQAQIETYYFNYTMNDVAFYVAYSGDNPNYIPDGRMFRVVMNWRGY